MDAGFASRHAETFAADISVCLKAIVLIRCLAVTQHILEGHRSMAKAKISRVRPGLATWGLLLLASLAAGCSGEYGSVAGPPKAGEVAEAVTVKKGAPAPRVPRGPGQAKALQDAAKQ
jgi:hypothetical protein